MIAKCVCNRNHENQLTIGRLYGINIDLDVCGVVNDVGKFDWYDKSRFKIISNLSDTDWIKLKGYTWKDL